MAIVLDGTTGLAGAATGALNGTLGATTPSTVVATTVVASSTIKGATTIAVGNATPSASGAGITFPATQSASTDVNTLDDYEEGTWTPTYASTGATITHTGQTARYIKVGSFVWVSFAIQTSGASGTLTNGLGITGLPFTPLNVPSNYSTIGGPTCNFTTLTTGICDISGISLYQSGTISSTTPSSAGLNSGNKYLWGSACYQTA